MSTPVKCSDGGCDDAARGRHGMCKWHYQQQRWEQKRYAGREVPSLPGERWLPASGYEGVYDVSDHGRVRRLNRLGQPRRLMSVFLNNGRVLVNLTMNGKTRLKQVSVLVAEAFIGTRPEGMWCCHNNGDATNNRPENLRWDTPSANYHDMARHGTDPNRNRTHCSRLHLLTAPNLRKTAAERGRRSCLACGRTHVAASARRRRGLPPLNFREEADRRYAEIMGVKPDGGSL
ncbi:MAG TPA: NUMOD4 motif-containing HNH endonuclease [Mycobacterium sp.]|uniref:NUMOD4 motif-containing HNH endonuclease n=1 Tax=Mycobacterium sp. TaxID=1785 RepID=UPI002F411BBB